MRLFELFSQDFGHNEYWKMTALQHTIMKTLKQESNNQLCLALDDLTFSGV